MLRRGRTIVLPVMWSNRAGRSAWIRPEEQNIRTASPGRGVTPCGMRTLGLPAASVANRLPRAGNAGLQTLSKGDGTVLPHRMWNDGWFGVRTPMSCDFGTWAMATPDHPATAGETYRLSSQLRVSAWVRQSALSGSAFSSGLALRTALRLDSRSTSA